jgi:hypothetical protein
MQKYGNVDADDIRMKLDAIKQEPKRECRITLNASTSYFGRVGYQMSS